MTRVYAGDAMTRAIPCLLLALALSCAACADEIPATQVIVIVEAEPGVQRQAEFLSVLVSGYDRQVDFDGGSTRTAIFDTSQSPYRMRALSGETWGEYTIALAPLEGDATRVYEVEVRALRSGVVDTDMPEAPIAVARVRSGYTPRKTLILRVTLYDACIGVMCEPNDMCARSGACVETGFVDPMTLRPLGSDAGTGDAGTTDSGSRDGGADTGPVDARCTAASCDDGNVCNGVEICGSEGGCLGGTAVVCGDGIPCTVDTCVPATGACVATPDDGLCIPADGTCDPTPVTGGCNYPTCTPATCIANPCGTAVCVADDCVRGGGCGSGTCCAGACAALGCDDGEPCTNDSCGATGCVHANNTATCEDGNFCTVADTCAGGACGGSAALCTDGNPCTDDMCAGTTGCFYPLTSGALCDDLNACTTGDRCAAGLCGGTPSCGDAGPPDLGLDFGFPDGGIGIPDGGTPDFGVDFGVSVFDGSIPVESDLGCPALPREMGGCAVMMID